MDMHRIGDVERLVESQELVLGKRSKEVANNLTQLGSLEIKEEEYAKAEVCFLRALDIKMELCGPVHADVLEVLQKLIELYRKQERSADLHRLEEWEHLVSQELEVLEAQAPRGKGPRDNAAKGFNIVGSLPASRKKKASSKRTVGSRPPGSPNSENKQANGSAAKVHPNSEGSNLCAAAMEPAAGVTGVLVGASGDRFTFRKQNVWIGRDWMNDIALDKDESVERSHAMISYEDGEYWIVNRATAGATTINGIPVRIKAKLDPGDIVTIGRTNMHFL